MYINHDSENSYKNIIGLTIISIICWSPVSRFNVGEFWIEQEVGEVIRNIREFRLIEFYDKVNTGKLQGESNSIRL